MLVNDGDLNQISERYKYSSLEKGRRETVIACISILIKKNEKHYSMSNDFNLPCLPKLMLLCLKMSM